MITVNTADYLASTHSAILFLFGRTIHMLVSYLLIRYSATFVLVSSSVNRFRIHNEEIVMSILVRFSPPSLTAEQYDAVLARLYEEGIQPAPGLELEVCFGSGDQMKVSVLFDSQEHLDAFGARLQPILAEMGVNPGEPEVVEVHHVLRRGA